MRIITPMVVGGIIGYITNWLAIKMLFRPHTEIRILGIKMPFTPGLIPKESKRIAKNIGDTVGEHLLSPDIITKALSKPELNNNIKTWISTKVQNLGESQNSLKSLLKTQGDEKYNSIINHIENSIADFLYSKLDDEVIKAEILQFIENTIEKNYGDSISRFILERGNRLIVNISQSKRLKLEIERQVISTIDRIKLDERTLYDIIPENIILNLNNYIDQEQEVIVKSIKDIVKTPEIKNKLKSSLVDLVYQNVNKVITMFITPEQIIDKVFSSVEKYMDSPEIDQTIIFAVKNIIDKILGNKLSIIAEDGLSIISNGKVSIFTDLIMDYISNEDNQDKLYEQVKAILLSEEQAVKRGFVSVISDGMESIINSNEIKTVVKALVNQTITQIVDIPIASIIETLDENKMENIINFLNDSFHNIAKDNLPAIISGINISQIVEDQINSFEVEYAEELILDIAKKELNAITWLGALLGIVMGLLTPLIQTLY